MANPNHLRLLLEGAEHWNHWSLSNLCRASLYQASLRGASLSRANLRRANLREAILSGADLSGADLYRASLEKANLAGANLSKAKLSRADLRGVNLTGANLSGASLSDANLGGAVVTSADLRGANLFKSDLSSANLLRADLAGANLKRATLVGTNLADANLTNCCIYGISAWDVNLQGAIQIDLVITHTAAPTITVDNLEVAQFIYLLLNNQRVRHVIDTITSKVVLILGRFSPERKPILDVIRDQLRNRDYLPVLFDFEKPANRDITETVSTLAHMARFIIADITDAKSISQELMRIVPALPSVPVQPLLLASQQEYGMFEHFRRFPWVLEPFLYENLEGLLAVLTDRVIGPAETKAREQTAS